MSAALLSALLFGNPGQAGPDGTRDPDADEPADLGDEADDVNDDYDDNGRAWQLQRLCANLTVGLAALANRALEAAELPETDEVRRVQRELRGLDICARLGVDDAHVPQGVRVGGRRAALPRDRRGPHRSPPLGHAAAAQLRGDRRRCHHAAELLRVCGARAVQVVAQASGHQVPRRLVGQHAPVGQRPPLPVEVAKHGVLEQLFAGATASSRAAVELRQSSESGALA